MKQEVDILEAIAQRTSKAKTVRIISPHSSTSDENNGSPKNFPALLSQHSPDDRSPPPSTGGPKFTKPISPVDPFAALSESGDSTEEEIDEEILDDATEFVSSGEQGPLGSPPIPASRKENPHLVPYKAQRTLGMPSDPFLKPPNFPIEPSPGIDNGEGSARGAMALKSPNTSSSRMPLDVDAFKRLLLTGEKESSISSMPSTSIVHAHALQGSAGDNSSNTDASSLSRQSIFEPQTDPHIETPRTSREISPSDDEQHRLVLSGSPTSGRRGPPTPRTRNGKLVKNNFPQTVAFTDSTVSSQYLSSQPTTPTRPAMALLAESSSDLNKSLPPLPTTDWPEFQPASFDISLSREPDNSIVPQTSLTAPKRIAPPPPLARRQSQLQSRNPLVLLGSSKPIVEEFLDKSSPIASKPPIPPPPRRRGTNRSLASIAALSAIETPSSGEAPMNRAQGTKPPPPAPPARTASSASAKSSIRGSPNASLSLGGPPLPPPRRRGSSTSSYSAYRTGADHGQEAVEGVSVVVPIHSPPDGIEASIPSSSEDVMAHLSALQKEVDALRGKYGTTNTSHQP